MSVSGDDLAGADVQAGGGGGVKPSGSVLADAGNVNQNPNNNPYASPLTLEQLDPGIPMTVAQAKVAYGGAMEFDTQFQTEAKQFIEENGAAVIPGHAPVGMGGPTASGADETPQPSAAYNQTTEPAFFDASSVGSVDIPPPGREAE